MPCALRWPLDQVSVRWNCCRDAHRLLFECEIMTKLLKSFVASTIPLPFTRFPTPVLNVLNLLLPSVASKYYTTNFLSYFFFTIWETNERNIASPSKTMLLFRVPYFFLNAHCTRRNINGYRYWIDSRKLRLCNEHRIAAVDVTHSSPALKICRLNYMINNEISCGKLDFIPGNDSLEYKWTCFHIPWTSDIPLGR